MYEWKQRSFFNDVVFVVRYLPFRKDIVQLGMVQKASYSETLKNTLPGKNVKKQCNYHILETAEVWLDSFLRYGKYKFRSGRAFGPGKSEFC